MVGISYFIYKLVNLELNICTKILLFCAIVSNKLIPLYHIYQYKEYDLSSFICLGPSSGWKSMATKVALRYRDYETAQDSDYLESILGTVRQAANAFVALGSGGTRNIGIFHRNKPEWFYVDFGAFANRGVTIPFYATSSPAQAQYIINDAQIRYLFVGEQYQYDSAFSIFGFCSSLQQLIIFDRSVVKTRVMSLPSILMSLWQWAKDCRIMRWWKNVPHVLLTMIWLTSFIYFRYDGRAEGSNVASFLLSGAVPYAWRASDDNDRQGRFYELPSVDTRIREGMVLSLYS